jgi:hypothetical protein
VSRIELTIRAGRHDRRNCPVPFSPPDAASAGTDHLHHKSLFVAWGDVNGSDNWSEGAGHGRQEHQAFAALVSGPV